VCVCVCVWCREDGILTLHCPISDLPSEWSPPTLTAAVYAKLASLAQEFHNKAKIERILSPFLLIYSRAVSIADISDRDYKFVLDLRGLGSYRIHSKELPLVCDFIVACRIRKRTAVVWLTDWLTGWLTDWLTGWLTDWLVDWLADCLIGWLTDWLADWLSDWLTDWLADWLTYWLSDWLADWLACWLTEWLADWLTDWLAD